MKKKLLTITLSLVLVLSLVACGGKDKTADAGKDKTIETANSNDEATKDKEKPEEKEPEIAPVVEAEDEVEEEIEEEIEEEKLPTTTEEIKAYLLKNGESGDFMISDENIIVVKIGDYVWTRTGVTFIDNTMYLDNSFNTKDESDSEIETFGRIVEKAYQEAPKLSAEKDEILSKLTEEGRIDTQAIVLRHVEPTDDPDKVKITILTPNGDTSFLPEEIKMSRSTYIGFGALYCDTTCWDEQPLVRVSDIQNNRISFIVNKELVIPTYNLEKIPIEKQTSDLLTALSYQWRFSQGYRLGDTDPNSCYANYELVD